MPIYEYKCEKCGHIFELRRPYAEAGEGAICTACGGASERLVSGFASQIGYYVRAPKEAFRETDSGKIDSADRR
jgi:putative FmdB family regulatory protein